MQKSQVDMTLNIDIANNRLIISEDLRRVHCGFLRTTESVPRFKQVIGVLGSPCFTSGRHYWEVDVGTDKEWDLGAYKESVNRQENCVVFRTWLLDCRCEERKALCSQHCAFNHPLGESQAMQGMHFPGHRYENDFLF
nr:ret finger protein-like 4A [Macaca nemestrina]